MQIAMGPSFTMSLGIYFGPIIKQHITILVPEAMRSHDGLHVVNFVYNKNYYQAQNFLTAQFEPIGEQYQVMLPHQSSTHPIIMVVTRLEKLENREFENLSVEQYQNGRAEEMGDPKKTCQPAVLSGMNPTCENSGATPSGIKPSLCRWEVSSLTTTPLQLHLQYGASPIAQRTVYGAIEHYGGIIHVPVWIRRCYFLKYSVLHMLAENLGLADTVSQWESRILVKVGVDEKCGQDSSGPVCQLVAVHRGQRSLRCDWEYTPLRRYITACSAQSTESSQERLSASSVFMAGGMVKWKRSWDVRVRKKCAAETGGCKVAMLVAGNYLPPLLSGVRAEQLRDKTLEDLVSWADCNSSEPVSETDEQDIIAAVRDDDDEC
ncbi:hypothetical protein PR048_025109 [Dryococelus australis]|uniref:Uncharacterized protein n=1 Tax=Dryococelus australis TaxID=614101 RepID=A0ABQ9GQJ6_9NEOP|nr:hypothetical protein PR048_025109 [Dryococelus australis]